MKLVIIGLSFLISSTSLACTSGEATRIRKFLAKLVIEGQYDGSYERTSTPAGGTPTSETLTGYYTFSYSGDVVTVTTVSCSAGDDRQCESNSERFQLISNCLYVDGRRVNVISSSLNNLRFEYDRKDSHHINRYDLLSRRRLRVGVISTAPALTETRWFLGRGT